MHKAILWKKEGTKVRCNLCNRRCLIPEGKKGFCLTRENQNGIMLVPMYGEISMSGVDPIEKKPFFHFYPGSTSLSLSTVGCTFRCVFCQNYDITQVPYNMKKKDPKKVVEEAYKLGCKSISYTYNEPTVFFEYALDTAREALKKGLVNTFVTNGYLTPEAVDISSKYIQAMTVGIKGSLNIKLYSKLMSVPDPDSIKDTILELKRKKIHIEITDLIIPEVGDKISDIKRFVKWIKDNLGSDVPVHFTRFHPDWKLNDIPATSITILEKAHKIAKEEGLRYVYVGNVMSHPLENTYCPDCNKLLIERHGFVIKKWNIINKSCSECGSKINYVDSKNIN